MRFTIGNFFNHVIFSKHAQYQFLTRIIINFIFTLIIFASCYEMTFAKVTPNKIQYKKKSLIKMRHSKQARAHAKPHSLTFSKKPTPTLNRIINNAIKWPETQQAAKDHRVVKFVNNTVSNLRYSSYKLGASHFDVSRGIYILDCSSYVDRILKTTHPKAFSHLASFSGTQKPTTHDYYHFFNNLSNKTYSDWRTINDVEKLRAGDIIVFRYKKETKGHIMILMDKPQRKKDTYKLLVTDSAPIGHSSDTRSRSVSGIGIGTMLLKINPKNFQPLAYAWQIGARWERNVAFAMARPIHIPMAKKYLN